MNNIYFFYLFSLLFKNDFKDDINIPNSVKSDKNKTGTKDEESDKNIHLNFLNYYCCGNICRMKKHIDLFNLGISLYRKRMDIINVFTLLLLTEKTILKLENKKTVSFKKEVEESSYLNNNNNSNKN